jgi:hypothetical protein
MHLFQLCTVSPARQASRAGGVTDAWRRGVVWWQASKRIDVRKSLEHAWLIEGESEAGGKPDGTDTTKGPAGAAGTPLGLFDGYVNLMGS